MVFGFYCTETSFLYTLFSSVKQNVLAFAAELFFLLELEPVSCVSLAGNRKMSTKYIQLSSPGLCCQFSFTGTELDR